jgi:hypothetical protein
MIAKVYGWLRSECTYAVKLLVPRRALASVSSGLSTTASDVKDI